jgi:hypothetical protein
MRQSLPMGDDDLGSSRHAAQADVPYALDDEAEP